MSVSIDDAYKALSIISEVCKENEDCKSCMFHYLGRCGIVIQGCPRCWSLKEPKVKLFN